MGLAEIFAILMVCGVLFALLAGYPVGFTLAGSSLLAGLLGSLLGLFPLAILQNFPSRILGAMENNSLIAIPLFVFMGLVLEKSKLAEDMLETASYLLSNTRGGLALSVIFVGALLAASTGIIGATVITMSLIALPVMLDKGYNPKIATGVIAASGSLGQIIPPSIVLILLADAISNANQSVITQTQGAFDVVSVGDLFAAALVPGLVLVLIYIAYVLFLGATKSNQVPSAMIDKSRTRIPISMIFVNFAVPTLLILIVLGSILFGVAAPTEAAAIGAAGALFLAGIKNAIRTSSKTELIFLVIAVASLVAIVVLNHFYDLPLRTTIGGNFVMAAIFLAVIGASLGLILAVWSFHKTSELARSVEDTVKITSMVFVILVGASMFALVFRAFGGDLMIENLLYQVPGGLRGALTVSLLVMFFLGFFMDFIEITFVVVPLIAPPLLLLGADPLWLGILFAIILQTSFLTPPFGFALFYVKGAAPSNVKTADIWMGALPFVGLQLLLIVMLLAIPSMITWLPNVLN